MLRRLAERVPPLGVPIILVSALAEESSVVQGLDSGADDYITKPFRRAEFLARIRGKLQLASTAGAAGEQVRGAAVAVVAAAGLCIGGACVEGCVRGALCACHLSLVTNRCCRVFSGHCAAFHTLSCPTQAALPGPSNSGSDEPVVMCITDDEINHVVLEGILQSQSYRYSRGGVV